jgi:cell division protein FtsQ
MKLRGRSSHWYGRTVRAERRRRVVGGLLGLSAAVAAGSAAYAPELARLLPWLEVERVEVAGTHLLAPAEIVAASGIRTGQHLFEEGARWEEALRSHPVIADADVARRPPGTLRVTVTEKRPVAFLQADALSPATATGEILPIDPAAVSLDLPIVHGSRGDPASAATLERILAETERLADLDPVLMAAVSEIRAFPADPDALVLLHSAAEIVIPIGADVQRLAELRAVLADVETRRIASSGAGVSLDLRFRDQIVVRHTSSPEHS